MLARVFRFLFKFWPLQKGKQTLAHYVYNLFLKNSSESVSINFRGLNYNLKLSDRIQCIFYLTGLYEPETVNACLKLATSLPSVYLDVGANVGLLALQIKSQKPDIQAHLFEPDPSVFQQLDKNIRINKLNDVFLNQNAVSEISNQELVFHPSHENNESGWGRLENNENMHLTTNIKVKSLSLDDYLMKNHIPSVDLLKIDVEGAEESVLLGAKNALSKKMFKNIICEINEPSLAAFGSSAKGIKEILKMHGYKDIKSVDMNVLFQPYP